MKVSTSLRLATVSALALQLTACEAVKFVFKTGFWIGALVVLAVILVAGFFLRRVG